MFKKILLICSAAALAISCTTEIETAVVNQEGDIDRYISSAFSGKEVVRSGGSNRVILSEGNGRYVEKGDLVQIAYVGYVLGSSGPSQQFAADTATVRVGGGELVKGLDEGLQGAREGEEAAILFTTKEGYFKEAVGLVPEQSALMFDVLIGNIKESI